MTDIRRRREATPGDAACIWHCLDLVLSNTCESRDSLERNGLDELADEFSAMAERLEEAHAAAEKVVVEAIEDE